MSRLWRDELRVGLCPRRLVLCRFARGLKRKLVASSIVEVEGDPVLRLRELAADPAMRGCDLTVVPSDAYARYRVLPWNAALASESEWLAYAQHAYHAVHGSAAAAWRVRLSGTGRRAPRIACALDAELIEALCAIRGVVSIQPRLMAAFNARRRGLGRASTWLVLEEAGRLTLALIAAGVWKLIRTRQRHTNWQEALPDLLDREHLTAGIEKVDRVLVQSETSAALPQDRYRVSDITLPPGTDPGLRPFAMVLR